MLVGQAQSINLPSSFNDVVTEVCIKICKERGDIDLVSVMADGVGCDDKWGMRRLYLFLKCGYCHVGIIDFNLNGKNFRYQFLGGLSVVWMWFHMVDTELFRLAGMMELLWRINDLALDMRVLQLASLDTINKLFQLENKEYFLHVRLFIVNSNSVGGYHGMITLLWAPMLRITSIGYHSTLGTK